MKLLLCLSFALLGLQAQAATNELTVYSVYEADRLAPIFKPFTDRTNIKVNVVFGSSGELTTRLQQEGSSSAADLFLDKDVVFLSNTQSLGLYQPFQSAVIEKNVPASLIESGKNWFLIFYRARTIMYNPLKVNPSELSTYEALGDAKWKGRLCMRTSNNSYNEALAAFLVKHEGPVKTQSILEGWVANLSMDPIKGDREVLKAIADGQCDVGLANTYYLAPFIKADASYPVRPFFPNQATTGAHINGVGIGITKNSKNVAEATLLMEYLTSKEVQAAVAGGFFQYPVNSQAPMVKELVDFGPFVQDATNVGEIGSKVPEAKDVIIKAGYK